MTLEEFLEKCRERDGWRVGDKGVHGCIRNRDGDCPLTAVFGNPPDVDYKAEGRRVGLNAQAIVDAADGYTNGPYRKALLTLVKP